jgi:ligand-binding sensor domain-containing protein/signal transduction histidine kinase
MATRSQIASAKVISGLMLLIFVESGLALDPKKSITQYHLDVWTEREGLPQGSVQAITQTHDGYLWIGTRDGLARFDGVSFTVFRGETTPGLPANDIRALCEDKAGQLWIGTFNGGLSCYFQGEFRSYTTQDGLPSNGVLDIFQDCKGNVWFGTWNGLARWDSGRFISYGTAQGLVGDDGRSICEDARGRLWVATDGALNLMAGDRFEMAAKGVKMPESPLRKVHSGRDGALWIATIGEGLFLLQDDKGTYYTKREGLPDNKVQTVFEDRNGNIWIGTWSGLCRLQDWTFATLTRQDGLPHDYVQVLYEDWEGNLWIGTRGGGLARLRDGKFTNYTTREGLAHNFGKCVLEDREGAVWMGTHGGGLSRYRDGRFTNFTTDDGLASQYVWAIEQDREGNIWVGTGRPASLHVFKEGKFKAYGARQGLCVRNGIRAIAADNEGNLWIGGDSGGLCRFRAGEFTCFTAQDGLPSNSIRVIRQDRAGDLWIGTNDGLCRYRKGQFTSFTTDNGLSHNTVYAVFQDRAGAMWFGTQGGISRHDNGRFRSYSVRDGLFQNVIYQILEDEKLNLWLSSNRGVFSVPKQAFADFDLGRIRSLPCVSYGIADGMKTVQCEGANQPAGCKSREGKLWFPTANGVTVIDPGNIGGNLQPPPVLVEQAWVGKQKLDPRSHARLSPGTREFRFQYTALSFTAPEKVRFKYKLEGLDDEWVEAETRRVAFYNEIPPGEYRFRVIGCNSDGVWNEAGAAFAFSLAPYFYQTAWFYALCGLAIVVAGWSFHLRRMKQAQAQFALVLAERSRIARELHDTLAQGFAGIAFQLEAVATKLSEAPAQAQQHLKLALQMVRHSLAEARRSVMNLRSAALDNGDLGSALADTARQMMADKPVDVQLKIGGTVLPLPGKLENCLLRIGQEAITNALKYSSAERIQIELTYQPQLVVLRIEDNGRGFDPATFEATDGVHFGLLGMRERAKQMGARLSIQSHPGQGTEVVVEVPVN